MSNALNISPTMGAERDRDSSGLISKSAMGSPITASSNIRTKVKQIQSQLHGHNNAIEDTNVELKRVRQMLDPLRLSMKRYTDQLEINTNKKIQETVDNQTKENKRIDAAADSLREEDRSLKNTLAQMQQQMDRMAQSITQLQEQVFGNYDSDSDADKTVKTEIRSD